MKEKAQTNITLSCKIFEGFKIIKDNFYGFKVYFHSLDGFKNHLALSTM